MMRITLKTLAVVLVAASLIGIASTAAIASNGSGSHLDKTPDLDKMWKDRSGFMPGNGNEPGKDYSQKMEQMLKEGMKHGFFGRFNYSNEVMNGRFVAFELNESSGLIQNYSLKTGNGPIAVFDSVSIGGFVPTNISVQGSVMLVRNGTVQEIVHDNPTGMLHMVASGAVSVSLKLADGMRATKIVRNGYDDDIQCNLTEVKNIDNQLASRAQDKVAASGDRTGVLISGKGLIAFVATDQGNITIDATQNSTYLNATFTNDHLVFRAVPFFSKHHGAHEQAILYAIEQRRIVSEAYIMVRNGSAYVEILEYERTFTMIVKEARNGHLKLEVSSETHEGRVVIINLDQQTIDALKDRLNVKLDGADVRSTSNPLEVLYATGALPSNAVYCVTESNGTTQLMVYVPSFSVHSISVDSVGPLAQVMGFAGLFALIAAMVIVAGAAFVLLRRKG